MSHDQSQHAYQFDYSDDMTEVCDVEEPPRFLRSRTATQDLPVHVEIPDDGKRLPGWHRAHASAQVASCSTESKPVPISYMNDTMKSRRFVEHPLAPCRCWTEGEWEEADRLYLEKYGVPYAGPRP